MTNAANNPAEITTARKVRVSVEGFRSEVWRNERPQRFVRTGQTVSRHGQTFAVYAGTRDRKARLLLDAAGNVRVF